MILFLYDNRLKLLILDLSLTEPLLYLGVVVATTWLYVTCGKRPGVVKIEKSEQELQNQRKEVEEYWSENQGEDDGLVEPEKKDDEIRDVNLQVLHSDLQPNPLTENGENLEDEEIGNKNKLDISPPEKPESKTKYEQPPLHFCHKCNIVQDYRTRHCKSCDTCIAKFDHHCFWIGSHF